MAIIRHIKGNFDSAYLKPKAIEKTVAKLLTYSESAQQDTQHPRRDYDRRCGRDRRQKQQPVLIDLRSVHARRTSRRRHSETTSAITGIDVYA